MTSRPGRYESGEARRSRIAAVTAAFPPAHGGVERYVSTVVTKLAEESAPRVLTADLNLRETGGTPVGGSVPVEYLRSRRLFGERLVSPLRLWGALRRFDPNVVWTQHPSLTGDIAGVFARVHGSRWVATYHADVAPWRWYARPFGWWEARILRNADRVLVSSERYRRKLAARGIPEAQLRTFTLASWIGSGHPPLPLGTELGPDDRAGPDHPLLFVGGLDTPRAYKRPELLIQAVARLRQKGLPVYLWIVGDGDRRRALEDTTQTLGVGGAVEFLGSVPDAELARCYRRAWALVLPSDSDIEGFGTVCLEAVQYGCPVVTSDAVAAGDVLGARGAALTYPVADKEAMARVLGELWSQPELRRRLSSAALEAAPEFSWDGTLSGMVEPLREMARAPTAAAEPAS